MVNVSVQQVLQIVEKKLDKEHAKILLTIQMHVVDVDLNLHVELTKYVTKVNVVGVQEHNLVQLSINVYQYVKAIR